MKIDEYDFYLEFDGLFVEWEWDINDSIDVINVQMTHPSDPKDTDKWLDITDYVDKSQLIGQIESRYEEIPRD